MKLYYFLLVFFFSFTLAQSQTTAIPDVNFEQELVNQGIDTNGLNGNILDVDAQAITNLTLGGTAISNITGINAFVNLIDLDLGNNPIVDIHLNALTQLTAINNRSNDALNSIDFSQNIALENIYLSSNTAVVGNSSITTLDFSQNINAIDITINYHGLVDDLILPVTNTLTDITIARINDATLDFSLIANLENLIINRSEVSTVITLPNVYTNLVYLSLSNIDIPTIDISNYINLEEIRLSETMVENLLLPNSSTLTEIYIFRHDIQHLIDFSVIPNLVDLDFTYNDITPLIVDLRQNLLLINLDLGNNDMDTIDLSQNILLQDLELDNNNFTTLDLTQNVLLEDIDLSRNQLPNIDLTQNILLEYVTLSYNLLPDLDVTNNIALRHLIISNNLFTTTGLDLTQNGELAYLNISNNQVESLYILDCVKLVNIVASYNLFSGTDLLDQLFTVKSNYYGISASNIIDVSFNNLSGPMPDFASLAGSNANYFRFYYHNNAFEFGHIENQHNDLVYLLSQTNTFGSSELPIMTQYWYAPQAKVDTIDTINANAGDSVTLTTVCAGAQNHYTWFKDGIAIPGAPDSPNYTIPSVNSCDTAVYHSEITSDLVPFDNTNPPGTSGKNLLLIRNDITLNITSPTETCTSLISPIDGSTNIPINEVLTWTESLGACGYYLSIGTTSGGTDILNNIDVGDVESYSLGFDFPSNTQVFVTITPYFYNGTVLNCTEESFTTTNTASPTVCTTIITPANNDTNVIASTNISWNAASYANGYYINIGTTSGGTDIVANEDVGNTTTYNPIADLPSNTQIFVNITPYNSLGSITGCTEESFTTEGFLPNCTTLTSPLNNDTNVSVATAISWNAIANATGYFISIGTTSGGSEILPSTDVANVTTYNPVSDLPENTTIYVSIIPYNAAGNATTCSEESFTTEALIPNCTTLTSPLNNDTNVSVATAISWNTIANATGYFISIGTTSGGSEILPSTDVANVTTYNPVSDLPENTTIYVSIIPYNAAGNATTCSEESFTTEALIPNCTTLTSPLNNDTNVSVATAISWNAIANATGYFISIGTTSGGSEILPSTDVANVTTYNPVSDLPENTTIYVTIIPYNAAGNATTCSEESFTTEALIPNCTTLTSPLNNDTNVSVATAISWNAIANATGYFISIGTTSGGSEILPSTDVANVTTYNPVSDLPENTIIYVSIIPYNAAGNATACSEESFTTEALIPNCTTLTSPLNNDTNVSVSTAISWNAIANATGYFISIGTTSGGSEILPSTDVANVTTYNPVSDLPENTIIYVSIIPYNAAGNATTCSEESFTIESLQVGCVELTSPISAEIDVPVDSILTWDVSENATNYEIYVGTSLGGSELYIVTLDASITSLNLPFDLPSNTLIFVEVFAYSTISGLGTICVSHFTTEVLEPNCTSLILPINNDTNVSVSSNVSWNAISNATGYSLNIGTTAGGTEIVNNEDVGNVTTYNPTSDLPENTTIYVTIIPYNAAGNATACFEESFTTEALIPNCTMLTTPLNNDANVSVSTAISWNAIANATGYFISIGTTSGGSEILPSTDVANVTT
ncbi:hypothetical protein Q4512_14165, partial [Oceanihabitans sp. 2_MG-2023]|uniref:hypothetical protein n=1 Tax=Oceanihabitans sp. 2_MG-2023 TaxID=3062661 RepID=UPI0026E196C0